MLALKKIKSLKRGKMYVYEDGFEESFKKNYNNITFCDTLTKSDYYFICVNTIWCCKIWPWRALYLFGVGFYEVCYSVSVA